MNKGLLLLVLVLLAAVVYILNKPPAEALITNTPVDTVAAINAVVAEKATSANTAKLQTAARQLKTYAAEKRLSTAVAFLIDMSLPSGKKRFFVYDLSGDTVLTAGLVAHGSCNQSFLAAGQFSNTPNSGCTSLGRYKVGYAYTGSFGKAYKLFGLDSTNNKAFERYVVLHGYSCVPDEEQHPYPICNSFGCPMVSYTFLAQLQTIIDSSRRPILLSIYQ